MLSKRCLLCIVLSVLLCSPLVVTVNAALKWSKTYAGETSESAYAVVETLDGGYALGGIVEIFGGYGTWLVKTDAFGNMEWNKTYQGAYFLAGNLFLVATSDGGYAMASGQLVSHPEDGGWERSDFWLVKTDAFGNMEWNKTYGGPEYDSPTSLLETSDGGFALAGITRSFGAGETDFWLVKTDSFGNMEWNKTYGGSDFDRVYSLIATSDGGYAVGGFTKSFGIENYFWLVKTDAFGNVQWNQTYVGTGTKETSSMACSWIQTDDGGYVLAGETAFDIDSDILLVKTDEFGNMEWTKKYSGGALSNWVGASPSLIAASDGGYAIGGKSKGVFWLIKTDSFGNADWNQTYPITPGFDSTKSIVATSDGGYVLTGGTYAGDFGLVKINGLGDIIWFQGYGGTKIDVAYSVIEVSEGGYVIVGQTLYFGAQTGDCWVIRTDWLGNMEWSSPSELYPGVGYDLVETADRTYAIAGCTNSFGAGGTDFWFHIEKENPEDLEVIPNRPYGGPEDDVAYSLVATLDGGYAMAGFTYSFGAGEADFWLIKIDMSGEIEWNQTYGGTGNDKAYSLVATSDNGYAIAGFTDSFGGGTDDFWLVKTDTSGNMIWNKTYGGTDSDIAYSLVETSDRGYTIGGITRSFGAGDSDFWLVKTDAFGTMEWNKTYGGIDNDAACSVVETFDGGYAIAGTWNHTRYYELDPGLAFQALHGDFWLVKTDTSGNMLWNQTYGGTANEIATSLTATSDGGYAIAGTTDAYAAGDIDFLLVKTDEFGVVPEYTSWLVPVLVLSVTAFMVFKNRKRGKKVTGDMGNHP